MADENHHDELGELKTWFDEKYKEWENISCEDGEEVRAILKGKFSSSKKGPSKPNREVTSSEPPDHDLFGFENDKIFLRSFLLDQKHSEEFRTLAVVGKHGVGKTTLCQAIFNDADVKKAYVPRVWVCMYGQDDDPKMAIVKRVLKSLGVDEDTFSVIKNEAKEESERHGKEAREGELARLLYALHLNLWGKKYLIVLDDAREEDGWSERLDEEIRSEEERWGTHLSYGFPKGSGGRVMFTSRDEQLAKKLVGEEHNLQRLYPISDRESVWRIYKDAAKRNGIRVEPRNEERYKDDLMDKSGGVPWAAVTLGTIEPLKLDDVQELSRDGDEDEETGSNSGKAKPEQEDIV